MPSMENKILNDLLDKYENSKLSKRENQRAIRIAFPFEKRTIPQYFDESSLAADDINAIAQQMERDGFISIEWKNHKPGHIIEKLVLREEQVAHVYKKIGRIPKNDAQEDAKMILNRNFDKKQGTVVRGFLSHMLIRLENGKSIKEYLDIMNGEKIQQFIDILDSVEQNQEECYIREFSIKKFGDSKTFESYIPRICKVIREENQELAGLENEEVLAEYHIYKTPGYVYFKGKAQIYRGERLAADAGVLAEGIGLSVGRTSENMLEICPDKMIDKVFTIENLTSFYRFEEEDSLIIYLGGYHNGSRRKLLMQIYQKLPKAEYYHFGDIDAGGFYIFHHLKKKTGIPFQMFQMDIDTLKKYESYAKALTNNDRKRLKLLKNSEISERERKLIDYMLQKNIKLEQECILEHM